MLGGRGGRRVGVDGSGGGRTDLSCGTYLERVGHEDKEILLTSDQLDKIRCETDDSSVWREKITLGMPPEAG